MRILTTTVENFQSYESMTFTYSDLGPALVAGPTKAGKSTLLDAPCWTLFGVTSKDSAADDVRSWFSNEPTKGVATVQVGEDVIEVTRIRSKRSSQNDLYFFIHKPGQHGSSDPIRGKDAADTQRLIEEALGVSAHLYLTGSYIHQFSKSDTFFVAKAKDRREIVEAIQDLSEPIYLAERASEARKATKKEIEKVDRNQAVAEGSRAANEQERARLNEACEKWEDERDQRRARLQAKADAFDKELQDEMGALLEKMKVLSANMVDPAQVQAQLDEAIDQTNLAESLYKELKEHESKADKLGTQADSLLSQMAKHNSQKGTCPHCLGPANNPNRAKYLNDLQSQYDGILAEVKPHLARTIELEEVPAIRQKLLQDVTTLNRSLAENQRKKDQHDALKASAQTLRHRKNTYVEQIETVKKETNPFLERIEFANDARDTLEETLGEYAAQKEILEEKLFAQNWIYDASFRVKAAMLTGAVQSLESRTNEILRDYFDAEIQVAFQIQDSDKIEVTITNESYECPFKQLSGGERCMLKLAFNVAYMEASQNCAGVTIDTVMLDEALNGLDADLKVKAYSLVEYLATRYSSVLVIEHSEEVKAMFPTVFKITKEGSKSDVAQVV